MLACYYSQDKQLASGVIGLLTCQSHYNVSGINRTPCARLLLRHPLDQRIPTCEWQVPLPAARFISLVHSPSCTAFTFPNHTITHTYIDYSLPSLRVWSRRYIF